MFFIQNKVGKEIQKNITGVIYTPNLKIKRFNEKEGNFTEIINGYFLVHPPNNGMPTMPIHYFNKGKEIFDNQNSFNEIKKFGKFIKKSLEVYEFCLKNNYFVNSFQMYAKLNEHDLSSGILSLDSEEILILNKPAICNNKVPNKEHFKAHKAFINDYLDHFIGWNFGDYLFSDNELEKEFLKFNELIIQKGMREYAGSGFEVFCSDTVIHYTFKKNI